MEKTKIALLGCTGSIGLQTLDVILHHAEQMELFAVSANKNIELLKQIEVEFSPQYIGIADDWTAKCAEKTMNAQIISGRQSSAAIAALPEVDIVVIAVTGMEAVFPLIAAAKAGKKIALANKESIVCGGDWMQNQLKTFDAKILPIDSEQSAIFQCLQGLSSKKNEVDRLILTASGGPFRTWSFDQIEKATLEQTLRHPNWSMGKKITIDSATLINKGLEVIEARYLFDIEPERIDVLIHPQSIVHSMVECVDGAILAQLGSPDMRLPIQYALTFPNRMHSPAKRLTIDQLTALTFDKPNIEIFNGLSLAYDAMRIGGTATAIYNAANEQAVQAFLERKISFIQITELVDRALEHVEANVPHLLEDILEDDARARAFVRQEISKIG